MSTMWHALKILCFMALFSGPCGAQAAAIVAADQGGGYAAQILEKVSKVWQAPHDPSERTVRIRVSLDGDGKVLKCEPVASSSLAIMDKSACSAVHTAEKFTTPPYGMPIDVYLTFWTGLPKGGSGYTPPSPNAGAGPSALAAQNADAANSAALALAKAAEARAAQATGKSGPAGSTTASSPATSASPAAAPSTVQTSQNNQNGGDRVGPAADIPTPEEKAYASKVRRALRAVMVIPAELPKGNYTLTLHVRLDAAGKIQQTDLTKSSGVALLDKYALRAPKRSPALPPPPSKKLQDLHLTFTLQRL